MLSKGEMSDIAIQTIITSKIFIYYGKSRSYLKSEDVKFAK